MSGPETRPVQMLTTRGTVQRGDTSGTDSLVYGSGVGLCSRSFVLKPRAPNAVARDMRVRSKVQVDTRRVECVASLKTQ